MAQLRTGILIKGYTAAVAAATACGALTLALTANAWSTRPWRDLPAYLVLSLSFSLVLVAALGAVGYLLLRRLGSSHWGAYATTGAVLGAAVFVALVGFRFEAAEPFLAAGAVAGLAAGLAFRAVVGDPVPDR